MLHILPGRPSRDDSNEIDEQGNYKYKKKKEQKKAALRLETRSLGCL